MIVPVDGLAVTGPQLSVAVAVPRAESIADTDGLQDVRFNVVPVAVITGAIESAFQVTVLDTDEVFPHASVAVQVLV